MKEDLPYLTDQEKETFKMCLANIEDKLHALQCESNQDHCYKTYIKEKSNSIYYDIKVILNMCE